MQLYFHSWRFPRIAGLATYVRTHNDPAVMADKLRQVVYQLAPTLPVADMRTVKQRVDLSLINDRLIANLSAAFGALATLRALRYE
jgi:hypothetical protein